MHGHERFPWAELSSEHVVLTATRRLAESIRGDLDRQRQMSHQRAWETPQILPLQSWLTQLWRTYPIGSEQLLTPAQEQQIWRKIIQSSCQTHYPLLHVDNTVTLVQQAWQLLNHWAIPLAHLQPDVGSAEAAAFIDWAQQFTEQCQRHHWLSETALPRHLHSALAQYSSLLPRHLIITGFDELPPAYQQLLNTLSSRISLTILKPAELPGKSQAQIFTDLESEITHMALWAKQWLGENPDHRIGCVAPELTQHRAMLVRIFKQTMPAQQYNISAGQYLHEFAAVQMGLQILQLQGGTIAIESLGEILQSPYLADSEIDINAGAQLDAQCRRMNQLYISFSTLFTAITNLQNDYPQQSWLRRWRRFAAISQESADFQLPSVWGGYFIQQLNSLGWPGSRGLNSEEYQVITRWQELWSELAELDLVTGPVTRHTALHALKQLTAQTIFQPQTHSHAPIQILGALESGGLYFDALWVMGLDDQHWPPAAQPNPFLPHELQIKWHMPHASSARELAYTRQLTRRLLGAAPQIRLSCSAREPDQPVRLSRLISAAPCTITADFSKDSIAQRIFASARRENYRDLQAPAVTVSEKIRGGSSLFTRQAACPFQAFAVLRLQALGLETPQLGISPRLHGTLVHATLASLWSRLQNQQNLAALNDNAQQQLLIEIISQIIHETVPQPESVFAKLEKNRLINLISVWLELEKQRPPFEVKEQEAERNVEFAGLQLHLKIDRIDQLQDGKKLLIDYKTSANHIDVNTWFGERPSQPQLPLYALTTHQQALSGIAFAQLHVSKTGFKGLHSEDLESTDYFPPGIVSVAPECWSEVLVQWETTLQQLGKDFLRGYAAVDPIDRNQTCQNCDLHALCRIHTAHSHTQGSADDA